MWTKQHDFNFCFGGFILNLCTNFKNKVCSIILSCMRLFLRMSRWLLSLWKFSFFELKFKTWDCKLYISYIRCLAFHLFNIWYSIFMFNFQFWFPFLKLSGVGTWRDVSDQKRQEVAKTTAGATKGFRDPFVQFFHHREFIFFLIFSASFIVYW